DRRPTTDDRVPATRAPQGTRVHACRFNPARPAPAPPTPHASPPAAAEPGLRGAPRRTRLLCSMPTHFELVSEFKPCGDQPRALREICSAFEQGETFQVLLGVTGSGKTFTVAKVIEK